MGTAVNWQSRVESDLSDLDIDILNPRRDDWDSSWKQEIGNDKFREQVEWELYGLRNCSNVLFYFAPDTKSPITLLELGMCLGLGKPCIVVCPDGFWRKGNVDIICKKFNIAVQTDMALVLGRMKKILMEYQNATTN